MKEKIRVYEDGQIQYIAGTPSHLWNPYNDTHSWNHFWRFVASLFDHPLNKYCRVRKMLYRDVDFEYAKEVYKKLYGGVEG